jgi:NAD(P)H-binding
MRSVVNTPDGNIGRVVTEQLLEAQEDVVIISRHPSNVTDLVKQGAHLVEGSIDDVGVLDKALKGADELFWLTPFAFDPPDYLNWARRIGRFAAETVKTHAIQRVVLISSVGAQHESGVGPIGCLAAIERAFAEAAPNATRCARGRSSRTDLAPRSASVHESIPLGRITGSICCQAGGSRWGNLPITPFSTAYKEGVKAASENDCGTLR